MLVNKAIISSKEKTKKAITIPNKLTLTRFKV
jgi:hypothetical protein